MHENEIMYINQPEQLPGIGILQSKIPPYNVGKPIRFENNDALEKFLIIYNLLFNVGTIPNYNIIIVYVGTKGNIRNEIRTGMQITPDILTDLKKMAEYYEQTKIKGNETRLKKYKKG